MLSKYQKKYKASARGKEVQKRATLKWQHGITLETFKELLQKQDGKCSICGRVFTDNGKIIHVDHCHKTGKIRGLLCTNCNTGIGNLRDSTELLAKAIAYLNFYNALEKDTG